MTDMWDDRTVCVFLFEAGGVFGRQVDSGSEMDDNTQLKFYTEHRGRRRSKGNRLHLPNICSNISHFTHKTVKMSNYCQLLSSLIMHAFQKKTKNCEIWNK